MTVGWAAPPRPALPPSLGIATGGGGTGSVRGRGDGGSGRSSAKVAAKGPAAALMREHHAAAARLQQLEQMQALTESPTATADASVAADSQSLPPQPQQPETMSWADEARAAEEAAADACAGDYRPPFRPAGAPADASARRPMRLFSDYRHVPSTFSRGADAAREEAWQSEARALAGPFVPAGSAHRLKHENMLAGGGGGGGGGAGRACGDFKYPTLAVGDPYGGHLKPPSSDAASSTAAHHPAPFRPAGRRRAAAVSRRALPDALRALHGALLSDWGCAAFGLLALEDDTIAVRFDARHVRLRREALRAWMTTMARAPCGIGAEYRLTIALDDWNREPGDGWVYFLLRPPWVAAPRVHCNYTGVRGGGGGGSGGGDANGSSVGSVDDDMTLHASATFSMIEGGGGGGSVGGGSVSGGGSGGSAGGGGGSVGAGWNMDGGGDG